EGRWMFASSGPCGFDSPHIWVKQKTAAMGSFFLLVKVRGIAQILPEEGWGKICRPARAPGVLGPEVSTGDFSPCGFDSPHFLIK
ncbi:MAG: hypothetical protein ACI4VM_00260, partial [Anaerovoracaceae bacterium]